MSTDNITDLIPRSIFPDGLPPSYVFVATLKYKGSVAMEEWDLWRIQTQDENPQMAISLNGFERTVLFTTTSNSTSGIQTVIFKKGPAKVTSLPYVLRGYSEEIYDFVTLFCQSFVTVF